MASAASRTRSAAAANTASDTGAPSIWNRSWNAWRWGDTYSPTRYPAARRTEDSIAQMLPLPLLPATWTNFSFFCGFPTRSSSSQVRSSPSRVEDQVWVSI